MKAKLFQDFQNGISAQLRVVGALTLREIQTTHGRENIGYLWAIVEPLILLAMFLALYHFGGRKEHLGMNLVSFLTTGIMTYISIRKMAEQVSSAVNANQGLLYHTQVIPTDTMFARIILKSATFIIVFSTIILGGWLLGEATLPYDLSQVVIALLMVCFLGASIGIFQSAVETIFPLIAYIMRPIWRVMFFTSCVFYTLRDLSPKLQAWVEYNPIAHVIELLRAAYFMGYETPIEGYSFVLRCCIVFIFFGLLMERLYRHQEVEI